jgi:23S rRNA pseudouridine1911/1915/1917 synthase
MKGEPTPGLHAWQVGDGDGGERLDRHVAAHLDVSRNQAQGWIADARVRVGGRPAKASRVLSPGDAVECDVPEPRRDDRVAPEAGEVRFLHVDDDVLVVDKPAGLTVHPGAGRPDGTLVHRLLHHHPELAGVGGPGRPGIVHRLDKDTSGVLVVARHAAAYRSLQRAFAERRVDKRYLAVVYGDADAEGEIDAPIGRHPQQRKKMTVRPGGRPAHTRWRRIAGAGGIALLEVTLLTGRTHQIRVHLKHVHHPLVGDPAYGEARWKALQGSGQRALRDFPRPALHAWRLAFPHPGSGETARFEAPVPEDLRRLWRAATGHPFPPLEPAG